MLLHSSSDQTTITASGMCINITIEFSCYHRSNYNIPCGKGECKENAEHIRKYLSVCRDCGKAEANRLHRELADAELRAKDAENALTRTPEDSKRAYATLKAEYLKLIKDSKQYAAKAEKFQKEATDRNTTLAAKLEQTRKQVPPNEGIHVNLHTTYACGCETDKSWVTKGFTKEDAAHHTELKGNRNENCYECREQEEANRDAAFARLTRAHAAEEQRVQRRDALIMELQRRINRLARERDELAERLDVIEGEAVAELWTILLEGQRRSEEIDARLNVLHVEQTEFMRQVDEQNAAAEIAMLELAEQVRTFLRAEEERGPKPTNLGEQD
jgi:hypothetical protein